MSRKLLTGITLSAAMLLGDGPGLIESRRAPSDFELTADPNVPQWKSISGVSAARDYLNDPIPGPPTEFRSRWTATTLYLLFICPFDELNLKPDPNTAEETPRLWNWDVGETFIGSDFDHIGHYKELQVSPQGEWVDLDINRDDAKSPGMAWNSGYKVKARIDRQRHVWVGEMAIPMSALGATAKAGSELRIGLYRIAGTGENKKYYAWQPTGAKSFHVPQAFGRLRMIE